MHLSLERIAEVRAALDVGPEPDRVLERAGIPPDVWLVEQERALRLIADDLDRGDKRAAET